MKHPWQLVPATHLAAVGFAVVLGGALGAEDSGMTNAPTGKDAPSPISQAAFNSGPGIQLWYPSLSLRAGAGYRDNVTLSHYAPRGSAFETLGADATLMRLPWNDWQFQGLATVNDTRFFDRTCGVDREQNAWPPPSFPGFPRPPGGPSAPWNTAL